MGKSQGAKLKLIIFGKTEEPRHCVPFECGVGGINHNGLTKLFNRVGLCAEEQASTNAKTGEEEIESLRDYAKVNIY